MHVILYTSLVMENGEYERAAAIAVFNLKIGKAIDILSSTAVLQGKLHRERQILDLPRLVVQGFYSLRTLLSVKVYAGHIMQ